DGGLHGDGWSMPRSDKIAAMRDAFAGLALMMGIRPEHVALAPLGEAQSESFEAIITDREPRGDVDVVTVRATSDRAGTGGSAFVAEVAGPSTYALGQRVAISLDAARAHLFDAGTGNALRAAR